MSALVQRVPLVFGEATIATDGDMVSLTDMWRANGSDPSRRPAEWARLQATVQFVEFLEETMVGNTHYESFRVVRNGGDVGTLAHWQIAMAYAKYLSAEFHVWCNTVVRAHMEVRAIAQLPQTLAEALRFAADIEDKRQALALEVAVLTPKAEFHDRVAECTNAVDMSDVCKVLGIGLKKFYRRLRGDEIIELRSTRPLQVHMDAGRFTLVTGTHETNSRGPQMHSTTKVTAKGFLYLVKKYGKPGKTYQLPSIGVETTVKPLPPAPAPTLFDGMAAE